MTAVPTRHVQQAYGAAAATYIELFASPAAVHADDLALIGRHLTECPGVVLDAGCGPGHLTAHLGSLGADAIGIDLVPEFIEHARTVDRFGSYGLGSLNHLPVPDRSLAGILAWYSLIHVPPHAIDGVLAELRRSMITGGPLVAGFFEGGDVARFEHKVVTAYRWPVDELSARLRQAGFVEVERLQRPGHKRNGVRPTATIAAIAT